MPIYEYKCKPKGHRFEVIQRMTEDPVATCEVCGAPVEKVMHSPAVHFKGSGFYSTDYGSKKRAREKEAAEGKRDSSKNGDSSKSEKSSDSSTSSSSDSSSSSNSSSNSTSDSKPAKAASGTKD